MFKAITHVVGALCVLAGALSISCAPRNAPAAKEDPTSSVAVSKEPVPEAAPVAPPEAVPPPALKAEGDDEKPAADKKPEETKKPEDPYAGVKSERIPFLKKAESMLAPLADPNSAINKGAQNATALLAEADARARAVMKLSQYRLSLTPAAQKQLLELTKRVPKYRPVGSFSRHPTDRSATLSVEWERLLAHAEILLREKIRAGEPFDKVAAQKIRTLTTEDSQVTLPGVPGVGVDVPNVKGAMLRGPRPRLLSASSFPNLETAIFEDNLTGDDLLLFLFDLHDGARQIEWHRARDRELVDLLKHFSNEERFLILSRVDASVFHPVNGLRVSGHHYVRVNREDVDRDYDFTKNAKEYLHGSPSPAVAAALFNDGKYWKDFVCRYRDTVIEGERERQKRLANAFNTADVEALESLRAAHVLHDELATFLEAAIPKSGYRIRRLVQFDEHGRIANQPIPGGVFEPIDPERYVLHVSDEHGVYNGKNTFHIAHAHTLDSKTPFSPADRIDFRFPKTPGTKWTYKAADGSERAVRVDKVSAVDEPFAGATAVNLVKTTPDGKDNTEEILLAADGVYCSKINGAKLTPPALLLSLTTSKTTWAVDSKVSGSGSIKGECKVTRKDEAVLGTKRPVAVVTFTGTQGDKAYTSETVFSSGIGRVQLDWTFDGKTHSDKLIKLEPDFADTPRPKGVKFDFPTAVGTTWTMETSKNDKLTMSLKKKWDDYPRGATTVLLVTTKGGTEVATEELEIRPGDGIYRSRLNDVAVKPPILVMPLKMGQQTWKVDSKVGDQEVKGEGVLTTTEMTVLGQKREVSSAKFTGTGAGKATKVTTSFCDTVGIVHLELETDGVTVKLTGFEKK